MRRLLPLLLCLVPFPCIAAQDDGDWEFLNRRLPDEKTMQTFVRNRERTDTFRFAPAALKFMEGAREITVFEGLPHQNFESKLLAKELEHTKEILIGKFPFYPERRELLQKHEAPLRALLFDTNGLGPFLYYKLCGGFHPDYALRFTKGEEHCDILICLGCGDARILHDGRVIHCHIYKGWKELLAGYTKFRPEPEPNPDPPGE